MDFEYSPRTKELQAQLPALHGRAHLSAEQRYEDEIEANTKAGKRWTPLQTIETLKPKARAQGLWNLFLPPTAGGKGSKESGREFGLSNSDYAPLAEIMGRVPWSPEVFNCSAPDTGNMETIERYGSPALKDRWLQPLLDGKIRSAFAMTEPAVASSDATNIESSIRREGDEYVINGRKWWTSGAGDPRCKIYVFMGKTDPDAPRHSQQSMVLVPAETKGITIVRPLSVFGYDDAPHGHMEVLFENVRVPVDNILLGEGRGFEIAQGRLGPGRIHHCMRLIGLAERSLELMCKRASSRVAFGRTVAEQGVTRERHRRVALPDRHGAPADAEGGVDDGRRRQQGGEGRDRDDQGRRAEHGVPGDRLGDAGARRRRRVGRLPARRLLAAGAAHAALRGTGPDEVQTQTRSRRSSWVERERDFPALAERHHAVPARLRYRIAPSTRPPRRQGGLRSPIGVGPAGAIARRW
jgi:acyl-CoA dehydrogenase